VRGAPLDRARQAREQTPCFVNDVNRIDHG
jgi:hypothetical protein